MLLPSLLFALTPPATAAVQDPVIGPVQSPAGDLEPTEAGGIQSGPYLTQGATGALAVWTDHRAEFNSPLASQGSPDVYAMRLDGSGQPLDAVALRLPDVIGDAWRPRAAWNGQDWLVVWENESPQSTSSGFRSVYGARISAAGVLLDSTAIPIKTDPETTGTTVGVGSDGTDWVVVAQGTPGNNAAVVAIRVLADGTVPDSIGVIVESPTTAIGNTQLEFAGDRFLLTYSNGPIRGQLIDPDLTPIGTTFLIGTGSNGNPRLATDGTNFVAVWENTDLGSSIRARGISPAGALTAQAQVTPAGNGNFAREPDVAWSGTSWHVVFRAGLFGITYRDARLSSSLSVLDPDGVQLDVGNAPGEGTISIASTSEGVVAGFERVQFTELWPGAILSTAIDEQPSAGPVTALSLSATRQGFSSLAEGPGQFAAAFYAEEQNETRIEFQRYDPFGASLDAEPLLLASGARLRHPKLAFNGDHYLVVWQNDNTAGFETDDEVFGIRVGADGVLLDPSPFLVMEGRDPAVAASDSTFMVLSSESLGDPDFRLCFAQAVVDGAPAGSVQMIGANFARFPEIAPLGDGWIATWQRNPSHDNPNGTARATLIAADGSSGPELSISSGTGFGGGYGPIVASASDSALVVWQNETGTIVARRILADGTLEAAFGVAAPPALGGTPAVTFDGQDYLVTWADSRGTTGLFDSRLDVYGARFTKTGQPLDSSSGFPIATGVETELQPAVAGRFGASLIGYTAFVPGSPESTLRLRFLRESPWKSLAGGFGSPTAPLLEARGDLLPGAEIGLQTSAAAPLTSGLYIASKNALQLPLLGGVLVPDLDLLLPLATDTDGANLFEASLPATFPPGAAIFVQAWIADPSSPEGLAASNGLSGAGS